MSKPKPGMQLRRPTAKRQPPENAVQALEERAEQVATKAPGETVEPHSQSPAIEVRKVQITAYLPHQVRDELRRAAVALSGPPQRETVTSIVERAIRNELAQLREEHGPFPETDQTPRPGRRVG